MNILEEVFKSLDGWGEHPVFIESTPHQKPVYTEAEDFKMKIMKTAQWLEQAGIKENYLVPLFLENSVDFICFFLGLVKIGAKPSPVKLEYRKAELDEIFRNSRPQAVISEASHLKTIQPYLPQKIVITRENGKPKSHQKTSKKTPLPKIPDEIASINYTYRGCGYPLGAMVPHVQYIHGAKVLQAGLQAEPKEKMLIILPMSHIFTLIGCIFVPILHQITSVIVNTLHPRKIFNLIREFRINHITAVPEIYLMLEKFKDMAGKLPSLKVFVSGGSLLSSEDYHRIKNAFDIDLLHGYGLTEFTPASRNIRGEARAGTVGPLCENVECKIMPNDKNNAGEILLKTDAMFRGYYKNPKVTKEAFQGDWFKTGDIGRMERGHLIFEKEKKKTRKVNGNMVDLKELERFVHSNDQENQLAAYKIPYLNSKFRS
ncbi:acyl--CoA ligase [bacterium]|nr:acyl--CoA ligase [bacterium]